MKNIFHFFLKNYDNESLAVSKKTRVLIKSCITSVLVLLPVITLHYISGEHWLLLSSDVFFIVLMLGPLFLIRKRKFEAAANLVIFGVSVAIILQNPVTDIVFTTPHSYVRSLETGILFTASIVLVALFSYQSYQLITIISIGIIAFISHYLVLIERNYQGQHSAASVTFIITYVFIMLLAGILAKFMLDMYNNIIAIAERESDKVKLTNLTLEMKVAARTRELEVQNDELKKVNLELDRFVYSVSHDLRAPLLSALGLINISKLEKDETQRSHYLELINKSMKKLDVFIQDIIHLSRNARLEMQQNEIDFTSLLKGVLEEHAFIENADKIEFITNIEQPFPFQSDIKRLKIVLNNIISNAIRYSNLYQPNPFVRIKVDVQHEKAIIEIADNGQGIAQEHIDKVFDMFYRASTKNVGSGLGLYIVKETIQKLNGIINLTSELEKGTTFLIEIPQAK